MVVRMRLLIYAAAILVSACATDPAAPSTSAPGAPPPPATAGDSRAARLLAAAGQPDAPTRAVIERELGAADIARQEGAGLALTYRLPTCALLLLFSANDRNEMRLQQAHVSPRRTGEDLPTLERCAAEASARR
jgi:hypothetical protein